jgi:cytidylate kinase
MIIVIDGPSGTGKSTVASAVAQRLGFVHFDTGAMYRSFAWKVQQSGVDCLDEDALRQLIENFCFNIRMDATGEKHYFVDDIEVSHQIRSQAISTLSSKISIYPFVRQAIVRIQRHFGMAGNAVFEGRDMGTVVFPQAELKIFLTAKPSVRAERRYRELLTKFPNQTISQEQILHEIEERDRKDTTRAVSPLRPAPDSIQIDTSDQSIEEAVDCIVRHYYSRLGKAMKWVYRCVYLTAKGVLKLFYRLRVYGLAHFRPGAAVIAANHVSFMDPPVISASCPEEVHFLAREGLFRIPLLGWLIRQLNSHPVARDASDIRTFRTLIGLLRENQKVILFPEGSRSLHGDLQSLEKGLSFLVYKTHCRILPVYVSGTYQIWKRRALFPRPFGRVCCVFGSPIEWKEFEGLEKKEAMKQISKKTEQAILSLQKWVHDGAQGTPP